MGLAANASCLQQSNMQPRALGLQQSNLRFGDISSPASQGGFRSHRPTRANPLPRGPMTSPCPGLGWAQLQAADTLWSGYRPAAGCAPLYECPRPGSRWRCGQQSEPSRLTGEPLTLKDLSGPAQAQAPSRTAVSQLLASVQHLEHQTACLRHPETLEVPGTARRGAQSYSGWGLSDHPQPSQPALASWDKRCPQGPKDCERSPPALRAHGKLVSPEVTIQGLSGVCLDSGQGFLSAQRLEPRESGRRWQEGPKLCSSAFSRAAQGALPGPEGGAGVPREQASREKERPASGPCCLPDTALPRRALQSKTPCAAVPESQAAGWQLLCRCFQAWRHLAQERGMAVVTLAVALGRRQLLQKGLRALRWALQLRDAQLEAAGQRHRKALLARSFREWRSLALQRPRPSCIRSSSHMQARSGSCPPGKGQGHGRCLGGQPAMEPSWRSSPGSLQKETGAWHTVTCPGQRPDDRGSTAQVPQALRPLTVFLLCCHQKQWPVQKRAVPGEATQRTPRNRGRLQAWRGHSHAGADSPGGASVDLKHQRAWLCRCFGAWQKFVQRGAQHRSCLADFRTGTLRVCLQQWVRMKQLRASDGVKVTLLSLRQQEAGNTAFCIPAPGASTSRVLGEGALPQRLLSGRDPVSLQEACRRLALQRVLLLWKTRVTQRQQADFFFHSMQQRTMCAILRRWRWRPWGPGTPICSPRTASALEPLHSILGGKASLEKVMGQGCMVNWTVGGESRYRAWTEGPRTAHHSPQAPSVPVLLETLVGFLRAAGQQRQGQCLLLWRVRAQQSRGAARWCRHTLQRRVLLGWSHWAAAQRARREQAARQTCARSCRAALGLWRRRLAQRQEAQQQAGERDSVLARRALCCWHAYWQRQQKLREWYQRHERHHQRSLRRVTFRGWRQAAAQRRCMQSHFRAWCEAARGTSVLQAQWRAFRDGLQRTMLRAAFATWQEAWAAALHMCIRHQPVVQASRACWRSLGQWGWADRQLLGTQPQHALGAWRQALGQCCETQQQAEGRTGALHWIPWVCAPHSVHISTKPDAAQTLSTRVPKAQAPSAAQQHVQRAAATPTQVQQAGLRCLQIHWAQWRTALFQVRLEQKAEAQEAGLMHQPGMSSRESLLLLLDAPAPWKQTHSCWTPATGPTHEHSHDDQRTPEETAWMQSGAGSPPSPSFQLWLQWPGGSSWAPGLSLWIRPGWPSGSPETRVLQRKVYPRRLGIQEAQAPASGPALLPGHEAVRLCSADRQQHTKRGKLEALLSQHQALAGQVPGSCLAALDGYSRGTAAGTDPGGQNAMGTGIPRALDRGGNK
ncbi:LOW QUALITY PROTEIN: uncharacterized protein C1orf167 homolog [Ochotona princeps]|uniref:LOW QUALITY PROTEIN: uncharacterized protein C1orf167 homolog n=1 Tax=Ochotona princeps TaxID=9978 RepID=UPI002714BC9E|nr:LOW QUALITY PROTEIN: uncharacterized protein C1orf167 homolog [Ochotona princeps]